MRSSGVNSAGKKMERLIWLRANGAFVSVRERTISWGKFRIDEAVSASLSGPTAKLPSAFVIYSDSRPCLGN